LIPESDDPTQVSRRHRRHHRRKRTRRGLFTLGAVAGALTVAGAAFAVTGMVEIGRDSDDATAGPPPVGVAVPPSTTSEEPGRPCRSPLNPLAPLRLWIGGDSLAGSLGPSLGKLTGDTGVVQPVYLSKVSSGLSSPDFWDWPKHAGEEMFKVNPEVAVFIIGANDTGIVQGDASEWRPQYEQTVEQMMTLLIGEDRTVYWVGAPIFNDERSEHLVEINQVFKDVAARHREVVYVDAYALFSTADGKYTPFLQGDNGETVRVRADDGVHFTPEGGDHLARAIAFQLEGQCSLLEQAEPEFAKQVIETEGSTKVPGTSRENGSGSTQTTRPRTTVTTSAPAPTTPPTAASPPATDTPTTAPATLLPGTPPT
jgi:uncharacterized protein